MKENAQSEKFMRAAREANCDKNESAFDDKLRQIAKAKPKPKDGNADHKNEAPE